MGCSTRVRITWEFEIESKFSSWDWEDPESASPPTANSLDERSLSLLSSGRVHSKNEGLLVRNCDVRDRIFEGGIIPRVGKEDDAGEGDATFKIPLLLLDVEVLVPFPLQFNSTELVTRALVEDERVGETGTFTPAEEPEDDVARPPGRGMAKCTADWREEL